MLWPNSLGEFYATFTGFLGFKPNSAEGKTMGLAAYGFENAEIYTLLHEKIFQNSEADFLLKSKEFVASTWEERYKFLEETLNIKNLPIAKRENIDKIYQDIAYAVQSIIVEVMIKMLKFGQAQFPSKRLCLAGGLAMNVSMNGKIIKSGLIDDIFVQPLASDNGSMLGAAILKNIEVMGNTNFSIMNHLYYGSEYSNYEIKQALEERNLKYRYSEKPWEEAAKLIADGEIIAWYNGRMEAGARALGNRSIISNPCDPKIKDIINDIKNREKWRPLAISILDEYKEEYLEGNISHCARFMIVTHVVKPEMRDTIPSALHIDNTTRPQVVIKEYNEPYYNLISEFNKLTGIPLVINTSLNDRGEPIVENPIQAIDFFLKSDLKALFLQNYIIKK